MPKRLAVTISGAVSLGSYEAGVMYEMLEAVAQHNSDPATKEAEKIFIDVITGASAGALTAAIAAQKLLYDGTALRDPDTNPLYLPWVVDVNITGLLNTQSDTNPTHSIFSSAFVESISKNYLSARYASGVPPTSADRTQHPAAAQKIYLGLALSNLNGINYSLQLQTGGNFTYTQQQDRLLANFLADGSDGLDTGDAWEVIRKAAVASGAFPFAFQVQDLTRSQSEYPGADPFSDVTELFAYTDGGVFQNEPLGMAKKFVNLIDHHQDSDQRFYLYVAPHAKSGASSDNFHSADANLWATAQRLGDSILNQAGFQDWITAETVNKRIRAFNERAYGLMQAFQKVPGSPGYLNATEIGAAAKQLVSLLFGSNASDGQTQAWNRLQSQFSAEYNQLRDSVGQSAANAWIDAVLTFETVAELGFKDEMNIYGITALSSELAGSDLLAFAGFFDQRYRQHDYDVGRSKAREFLSNPGLLGPIHYNNPKPLNPIDHSLDGLTLDQMDRKTREDLRDRLLSRISDFLDEAGETSRLIRGTIDDFIIKPKLNRLLKL